MEKEYLHSGSQGSGAAESQGKERKDEWNESADMSEQEKAGIATDIDVPKEDVTDIKATGGLSGRDDYGGGSDNVMQNQSTGQPTDL